MSRWLGSIHAGVYVCGLDTALKWRFANKHNAFSGLLLLRKSCSDLHCRSDKLSQQEVGTGFHPRRIRASVRSGPDARR